MTNRIGMDVEQLLRWAYVDELSKQQLSAAEAVWDGIFDFANHGGIDDDNHAMQRYAHIGEPHPDARCIERAVAALPETVIDWDAHFDLLAGDLAGLVSINDLRPRRIDPAPKTRTGWGAAGDKALKAFFGEKGAVPAQGGRSPIGRAPTEMAQRPGPTPAALRPPTAPPSSAVSSPPAEHWASRRPLSARASPGSNRSLGCGSCSAARGGSD